MPADEELKKINSRIENRQEETTEYLFGKQIAQKVAALPPRSRCMAQHEIRNIIKWQHMVL